MYAHKNERWTKYCILQRDGKQIGRSVVFMILQLSVNGVVRVTHTVTYHQPMTGPILRIQCRDC